MPAAQCLTVATEPSRMAPGVSFWTSAAANGTRLRGPNTARPFRDGRLKTGGRACETSADEVSTMSVLDLFRLDGKLAVVTGCRRGIGKAIAIALAEAGADIAGVSRNMEPSGSEVEHEVNTRGRTFYPFRCDFNDRQAVCLLAAKLLSRFPEIDILVNNAGNILRKPAVDYPDEYWDEIMETNLRSQFVLTREIGRRMVERGSGKIVFIASLLAFQGGILVPAYSASKGAIVQLAKALANEWASRGVQINAIAPGYIATDNTVALREDPERNQAILARIPAGRWGEASDVAGAAVYLASPASNYVNGSVLVVDGGWLGR
jgi:2-deoxy-D-gluconate 3-dehydrogenase